MTLLKSTKDPVQLLPFEYQWAYEAYVAGNANHWNPREISMMLDIDQWNSRGKLTAADRRVLKTNLGFFAASEIMVADNIATGLYGIIDNPECRMFLSRQQLEESIHTDSFLYIITSLGLDEVEMYTMYRETAEISALHDFISHSRNDTPLDLLKALVKFYLILEGVFFYSSFAQLLSLRTRNLMPGVSEMIAYIARDESVHINFGVDLINQLRAELNNPDLDAEFAGWTVQVVKDAVGLESEVSAQRTLRDPLPGLDAASCKTYIQWIANRRLAQLGIAPLYNVTESPLPWMGAALDLGKEVNFFEGHVSDYKSAATLEWD